MRLPIWTAAGLLLVCSTVQAAGPVDFSRDVRPILAQNCFMCHGPDDGARQAGLRLDLRDSAVAEADSGMVAIVPGHATESELIARITSDEDYLRMPPPETGRSLSGAQIETLRRWIDEGAVYATHWSFQPPVRVDPPPVRQKEWPRSPIDRFVLARLEAEGIAPSPEADRATLIRRLSLDLLGLPPTPAEVDDFVQDDHPKAYQRLVDRLLASPHFGERWGRHWLDLARYADSDGYLEDEMRTYAYRYRDWVIDAINRDLPYDRFTIEQIAGDLLPDATVEQQMATGFHRNALRNNEAGADREEDRVKRTVDRVSTTGTVWLGLTIGCAECHSHKFDPISQHEFYGLYAFFNNADERDVPAPTDEEQSAYEASRTAWTKEVNAIRKELKATFADDWDVLNDEYLPILARPEAKREEADQQRLADYLEGLGDVQRALCETYEKIAAKKPSPPATKAMAMVEAAEPRATYVHVRGDFRNRGDEVPPGTPAVLHPLQPRGERADRLDLAHWLVDPANPLTARVAVNRFWRHLFGRGLVASVDDFGATGETPSHPELLDWLAVEFVEGGWSRKELLRTIVTSSTYRQVSHQRPELAQRDPFNTLLARQGRFRVEAEIVRDLALAVSGRLNRAIGGPSIRPPLQEQVNAYSRNKEWKASPGDLAYRRGMYILNRRSTLFPMLTTFDAPDTTLACPQRERSNSPLQALTLLNDPVFFECAQHLGRRLSESGDVETSQWLRDAFRICLAREPNDAERERLADLYREQRELIEALSVDEQQALVGEAVAKVELPEQAARVAIARIIMNLDEFITRE